jgi:hypothetical protein
MLVLANRGRWCATPVCSTGEVDGFASEASGSGAREARLGVVTAWVDVT